MSWQNSYYGGAKRDRVNAWTLDIDVAGGTSKDAAGSIDASLNKIYTSNKQKLLDGIASDAGGGGTGDSAKGEIIKTDRATLHTDKYLTNKCKIHGFQLDLNNPMIQCCGYGGLLKETYFKCSTQPSTYRKNTKKHNGVRCGCCRPVISWEKVQAVLTRWEKCWTWREPLVNFLGELEEVWQWYSS